MLTNCRVWSQSTFLSCFLSGPKLANMLVSGWTQGRQKGRSLICYSVVTMPQPIYVLWFQIQRQTIPYQHHKRPPMNNLPSEALTMPTQFQVSSTWWPFPTKPSLEERFKIICNKWLKNNEWIEKKGNHSLNVRKHSVTGWCIRLEK